MTVKERIKFFIKAAKITQKDFELEAGLSNGYVNSIVNSISHKKLDQITKAFPDLNPSWVLLGEGMMILPSGEKQDRESEVEHFKKSLTSASAEKRFAAAIDFLFTKGISREELCKSLLITDDTLTEMTQKFPSEFMDILWELEIQYRINRIWIVLGEGRFFTEHVSMSPDDIQYDFKDGERLFQYFNKKGLTTDEVSRITSIPLERLESIKEEGLLHPSISLQLSRYFHDLNLEWVHSGKGRMLLGKVQAEEWRTTRELVEGRWMQIIHSLSSTDFRKLEDKIVIVTPFVGEFDLVEYVKNWEKDFPPRVSKFAVCVDSITLDNYISLFIQDDSMEDGTNKSIPHRSIVTGRQISQSEWTSRSVLNKYKIFIIHTTKDILVRKIASYDPATNSFRCESYNPDKDMYPTIDIKVDEVREIFNVEVITKNL